MAHIKKMSMEGGMMGGKNPRKMRRCMTAPKISVGRGAGVQTKKPKIKPRSY